MTDSFWGIALLILGAFGSATALRDWRRRTIPEAGAAGAGRPRTVSLVNIVYLAASVLATLAGAVLLLQ